MLFNAYVQNFLGSSINYSACTLLDFIQFVIILEVYFQVFKLLNPELNPSILDLNNLLTAFLIKTFHFILLKGFSLSFPKIIFIFFTKKKILDENILFNLKALFHSFIYDKMVYIVLVCLNDCDRG